MRSLLKILFACGAGVAGWLGDGKARGAVGQYNTCDFKTCLGSYPGFYDNQGQYPPVTCDLLRQSVQFLSCQPNLDYDCGYDPAADTQWCWGGANVAPPGQPADIRDCWSFFQVCNAVYIHPVG